MASDAPGCRVTFRPSGQQREVPYDTLLVVACRKARVVVPNLCGNRGLCTTCAALILSGHENLSPVTRQERRMLEWVGAPADVRLACQAHVRGPVELLPGISPIERLDYDPSLFPWSIEEPAAEGDERCP